MIHRGDHRHNGFAVRECQHGNFRTGQEFLDNQLGTALAEDLVFHNGAHGIACFLLGKCDDDTLAECQTVRLYDSRIGILLTDIRHCLFRIVKDLVFCRRNTIFLHQVLGKDLAALNDRGSLGRSEHLEAVCAQQICHTKHERIIRCNEYPVYGELFRQLEHPVQIGRLDRIAFGKFCNAAVSRRAVEFGDQRRFAELHDNGVLSAAAADY